MLDITSFKDKCKDGMRFLDFIMKHKIPTILLALFSLVLVAWVVLVLVMYFSTPLQELREGYVAMLTSTGLPLLVGLITIYSLNEMATSKYNEVKELETLKVEREEIKQELKGDNHHDIFKIAQLSVNHLNEYYTINKRQSTISYVFSMAAILAGLALIVGGIILNYTGFKTVQTTYLAALSGILLEFIGGAFFFMYKKSLEQVNLFYSQLIKIQDTLMAISLADGIKDDSKKSDMQEKIIVSLLERSLK